MIVKKQKVTLFQIITIAMIVMYLIWERNIQIYLSEHGLENTYDTRKDLVVIIPILLIMIIISLKQRFKKNKNTD